MSDDSAAELLPLFSREQGENAFAKAMNLFIGRGRRYSSLDVEKGSGISRRRIDCFRSYPPGHPDHRPLDMGAMMSIAAFLGPDFTSEWIKPTGQVAFAIPDGIDFDEYETLAREWLRTKGEAHHHESPAGRDLSDCEKAALSGAMAKLKAVG